MTDTRQVLEEAFKVMFGTPPTLSYEDWQDGNFTPEHRRFNRFRRLLDAEAWTDAAMMLVGPDRWLEFKGPRKYLNIPTPVPAAWSAHIAQWNHEGDVVGWGDTLAEAIAAACIKAKEQAALRAKEAGDV